MAFFDEGPRITTLLKASTRSINSSSIDTREIDAYRQGVEITRDVHQARGLLTIGTGELGAVLVETSFGQSDPNESAGPFTERSNDESSQMNSSDGALEPLTIRKVALRTSAYDVDHEHAIRGTLMGGTENRCGEAANVVTIVKFTTASLSRPFSDVQQPSRISAGNNGLSSLRADNSQPFTDVFVPSGVKVPTSSDAQFSSALEAMQPASDEYVPSEHKSMATGFTYDGQSGVDSIAFGGLEH